jgi:hypothetical protein
MHQSPQKLPGGCREKRGAAFDVAEDDGQVRMPRLTQPKAKRFLQREDSPRNERTRASQHPRG